MRLFFSYGHGQNEDAVERLKDDLTMASHSVWMDRTRLRSGDEWRRQITEGITGSELFMAFASCYALRDPGVCREEINIAVNVKKGLIITILLEKNLDPPAAISHRQYVDLSDWRQMSEKPEEEFEIWYQGKLKEIKDILDSQAVQEYAKEIEWLSSELAVEADSIKLDGLLKQQYQSRPSVEKQMQDWLDGDSQILIIDGGPGTGKSSILAHNRMNISTSITHFCQWDRECQRSPDSVIRNLALQLACYETDYRKRLIEILENKKKSQSVNDMSVEELFETLLVKPVSNLISTERDSVVVMIDAVDEMDQSRFNLMAMLARRLKDRAIPQWLRFIITTRTDNVLTAEFSDPSLIHLEQNEEAQRDMISYLDYLLADTQYALQSGVISEMAGSCFLFAKQIGMGIKRGEIDLDQMLKGIRSGQEPMAIYYLESFRRLFSDPEEYDAVAPTLSALIASRVNIPAEIFVSLIGSGSRDHEISASKRNRLFKMLKPWLIIQKEDISFFHKSLEDWLKSTQAGDFQISEEQGWEVIARYCWKAFKREELTEYVLTGLIPSLYRIGKQKRLKKVSNDEQFIKKLSEKLDEALKNDKLKARDLAWSLYKAGQTSQDKTVMLKGASALSLLNHELVILEDFDQLTRDGIDCAETLQTAEANTLAAKLCSKTGYNKYRLGDIDEALRLYNSGIEYAKKAGRLDLAAEILRVKAELLTRKETGDKPETLAAITEAEDLMAQGDIRKSNPALFAAVSGVKGRYFNETGQISRGRQLLEQTLKGILPMKENIDSSTLGVLLYSLANSYYRSGNAVYDFSDPFGVNETPEKLTGYEISYLYVRKSIEYLERANGTKSVENCDALNQLGFSALKTGRIADAEGAFRQSYTIREMYYGENNILTSTSFGNLIKARALSLEGRSEQYLSELDSMFRKTIRIRDSITKKFQRWRYVQALLEYSDFLMDLQRIEAATEQVRLGLEEGLKQPADDWTLFAYERLIRYLMAAGSDGEAKVCARDALEFLEEHPVRHPVTQKIHGYWDRLTECTADC